MNLASLDSMMSFNAASFSFMERVSLLLYILHASSLLILSHLLIACSNEVSQILHHSLDMELILAFIESQF